ncbi:hypothetical protein ES703_68409 [subsurface metagenome]
MAKIKLEDIIFWLLIIAIIAVALWLLSGSPPMENGLLMIIIFVAASEILLWKTLFKIDKKTAVGFERIKKDINVLRNEMNNNLNEIKNLIKK